MPGIREAIDSASAYLAAHPDEATYTDSVATASLEEGLRVRAVGPAGEAIVTDMPTSVGGTASAPSSGWFLRAAEAACVSTLAEICPVVDAVRRAVPIDVPVDVSTR